MPIPRRWQIRTAAVAATALATGWVGLLAATPARADVARSAEGWVLSELHLYAAWTQTQGSGVTVAVIDSGVDGNVSDIAGSVTQGPDYSGVNTPSSNPNWGVHGTWMASLVAGHGHGPGSGITTTSGILGAAPESKVLSIRVITDAGDPSNNAYQAESAGQGQQELADAITYAVNQHAGVISMSLGYSAQSLTVRKALQYAYEHNVVVVASAGNSGDSAGATGSGHAPYSFPADYPGVLSVGAVNQFGAPTSFSTENLSVQVAAPGDNVPAEGNDGQYWYVSGTSPACALTAGVVALIKSAYPGLNDTQVITAITSSTTPSTRPADGWDQQIGFGVVNAASALAAAGQTAKASPPAAGVLASSHFGGGPAAVPAVPVAPRGSAILVGYALLAVVGLGLVAFAASRLFSLGGSDYPAAAGLGPTRPAGPTWPAEPTWPADRSYPAGSAAPAAPVGPTWPANPAWPDRADPAGSAAPAGPARPAPFREDSPGDAVTRPMRIPADERADGWPGGSAGYRRSDRPDAWGSPAGNGSGESQRMGPRGARPPGWQTGSPSPEPRHAAPRGRDSGQPEQP